MNNSISTEVTFGLVIALLSFAFTFIISIPFIKLLYKYNIRRLNEVNLDNILPGRTNIKLGTPIMGGTVILISFVVFATLLVFDWSYYWMIVFLAVLGGIVGAIDEYTNALGKTLFAIRKSKSTPTKPYSFIKINGVLYKAKNTILIPWKAFEEGIRIMGSNQRGIKGHYKFLMHIGLALLVILFLVINQHPTVVSIPFAATIDLGFIYYFIVAFLLLFFANAFGITDGLDGLSAGSHSIAFGLTAIGAALLGSGEIALLSLVLMGAEMAFLYFNIKPARMQMSDVGTVPLGMLFALFYILLNQEVALFITGALFVLEIFSSVGQQWSVKLRKKRILLVAPIHHHFEKLGWSENKIVERFWLFTALTGILGLILMIN